MKRAALVVLLCAAPAFAKEVIAFAADGSSVVTFDPYEEGGPEGSTGVMRVIDLRSGAEETFECEESKGAPEAMSRAFAKSKKKQKFVKAVASRVSPDGKSMLAVEVKPLAAGGAWSGGSFSAEGSSTWTLTATRDGTSREVGECAPGDSLTAFWSPDGRHSVWLVTHDGTSMRDPGSAEVIVGTGGDPSVAVVALRRPAAEATAAKLSKAGFTVVNVSAAKKQRPSTVVYVSAGMEEVGKKVVASLPGASVATLDWASPFDVVVALGEK
jgi:hypothetical protein